MMAGMMTRAEMTLSGEAGGDDGAAVAVEEAGDADGVFEELEAERGEGGGDQDREGDGGEGGEVEGAGDDQITGQCHR